VRAIYSVAQELRNTIVKVRIGRLFASGVARVSGAQGNDENWRPPEGVKGTKDSDK
jgi:hypothetical protein